MTRSATTILAAVTVEIDDALRSAWQFGAASP
jgi:hypothetical protein